MALIERKPGSWKLKGLKWNDLNTCNLPVPAQQAIYGALCKLKDYEESGLDPDQVEKMMDEPETVEKGAKDLMKEFAEVAEPVIEFMRKNLHPHSIVVITEERMEILEKSLSMPGDYKIRL